MRLVIIGATGLVGALVIDRLLAKGLEVHGLARRATNRVGWGWHEHVAPITNWPTLIGDIAAGTAISCLGTTRKQAGSEQGFRAVDYDAVLAFAVAAKGAGARHLLTISSVGADTRSRNFYLRTKGEIDEALSALGFDRLDIFRPGLLLGERRGEPRPGERLAVALNPLARLLLRGRFSRYAGIEAGAVASAIAKAAESDRAGRAVHDNAAIRGLADQL